MPILSYLIVIFVFLNACALSCVAAPIPWDTNSQGQCLTALCADQQGHTFIGTEGQGLWHFDPSAPKDKQFVHFTTKDGLGSDSIYALLSDAKGRLWLPALRPAIFGLPRKVASLAT